MSFKTMTMMPVIPTYFPHKKKSVMKPFLPTMILMFLFKRNRTAYTIIKVEALLLPKELWIEASFSFRQKRRQQLNNEVNEVIDCNTYYL